MISGVHNDDNILSSFPSPSSPSSSLSSTFSSLSLIPPALHPPPPPPFPSFPSKAEAYNFHIREGKASQDANNLPLSLLHYRSALSINSTNPKLKKKIHAIQQIIDRQNKQREEQEEKEEEKEEEASSPRPASSAPSFPPPPSSSSPPPSKKWLAAKALPKPSEKRAASSNLRMNCFDRTSNRGNEKVCDATLKPFIPRSRVSPTPSLTPVLDRIDEMYARDTLSGDYHIMIPPNDHGKPSRYILPSHLYPLLYDYQRQCVHWLCRLHDQGTGGILGDDMGLGKSVQIAATLSSLFYSHIVHSIMLVMEISLIGNWLAELAKWCPDIPIYRYTSEESQTARERNRQTCLNGGGILIVTYGLLSYPAGEKAFTSYHPPPSSPSLPEWDGIILDEGHKIKNPDITLTRVMKRMSANYRIILSGTPIQNNLNELWCLMDWTCSGRLLGDKKRFLEDWALPIQNGQDRNASANDKYKAQQLSKELNKIIQPHLLRRMKKEIMERTLLDVVTSTDTSNKNILQSHKNDFIVWIFLSPAQVRLYSAFVNSPDVKAALNAKKSPLAEMTILKKLCDHPKLLQNQLRHCQHLRNIQAGTDGTEGTEDEQEDEVEGDEKRESSLSITSIDPTVLLNESYKLSMLLTLVENLRAEGHRTLIFSQSKKMLDLIDLCLSSAPIPFTFLRIDGTIIKGKERQRRIELFSSSNSPYSLFLLTTGVGGVGLNLTSADRCIIFDPSWNPAKDSQAVDRCYRIGQKKDVIIYRFITCGTIEEIIYRKQVFKQGLFNTIQGGRGCRGRADEEDDDVRTGYFTKNELREVFTLRNPRDSETQRQMAAKHPPERRQSNPQLDLHIKFLHQQKDFVFGLSDHDRIFEEGGEKTMKVEQKERSEEDEAQCQAIAEEALSAKNRLMCGPSIPPPRNAPNPPHRPNVLPPSAAPKLEGDNDWRESVNRNEREEEKTAEWIDGEEDEEDNAKDWNEEAEDDKMEVNQSRREEKDNGNDKSDEENVKTHCDDEESMRQEEHNTELNEEKEKNRHDKVLDDLSKASELRDKESAREEGEEDEEDESEDTEDSFSHHEDEVAGKSKEKKDSEGEEEEHCDRTVKEEKKEESDEGVEVGNNHQVEENYPSSTRSTKKKSADEEQGPQSMTSHDEEQDANMKKKADGGDKDEEEVKDDEEGEEDEGREQEENEIECNEGDGSERRDKASDERAIIVRSSSVQRNQEEGDEEDSREDDQGETETSFSLLTSPSLLNSNSERQQEALDERVEAEDERNDRQKKDGSINCPKQENADANDGCGDGEEEEEMMEGEEDKAAATSTFPPILLALTETNEAEKPHSAILLVEEGAWGEDDGRDEKRHVADSPSPLLSSLPSAFSLEVNSRVDVFDTESKPSLAPLLTHTFIKENVHDDDDVDDEDQSDIAEKKGAQTMKCEGCSRFHADCAMLSYIGRINEYCMSCKQISSSISTMDSMEENQFNEGSMKCLHTNDEKTLNPPSEDNSLMNHSPPCGSPQQQDYPSADCVQYLYTTSCNNCISPDASSVYSSHLQQARRILLDEEDGEGEGLAEEEGEWRTDYSKKLLSLSPLDGLRLLDCLLSALSVCDSSATLQASILLLHKSLKRQCVT